MATALTDSLAALLRGEPVSWRTLGCAPAEFRWTCDEEDLIGLVHQALGARRGRTDWPAKLLDDIAREARAESARELLRRREIISVLDALALQGIQPILLKGTALAYSVYEIPSTRPRNDTDLLIRREDTDTVRRTMTRLGYASPTYCDGELLFCQFELGKADEFGVHHAFDFHWKISTQSIFADILTYDELAAGATPVPLFGPHARAAGCLEALLLACVHPVMHHRSIERLIWIYDVHLLATRLRAGQLDRFVALSQAKRMSAICGHQLSIARTLFGTRIPDRVISRLTASRDDEPSAAYLKPARRWHDELLSNMGGLPNWTDRLRLLREVLFPAPTYMLKAYGLRHASLSGMLLPALYVHRVLRGGINVLVGRK